VNENLVLINNLFDFSKNRQKIDIFDEKIIFLGDNKGNSI